MKARKIYQHIHQFRENALRKLVDWANPIYCGLMPKNRRWRVQRAALRQMPEGSFGRDYADFMDKNQFNELPFLEIHDAYHVLLGYPTTVVDEARLAFWLFGNGSRRIEVLNSVNGGILFLPDYWRDLWRHYQSGRRSRRIAHWDLQLFMSEKTEILREVIFDKNAPLSLRVS
jgi:hypothetical protein